MKKVDLKKYTMFSLVCFFSLMFSVFAASPSESEIDMRISLPYESSSVDILAKLGASSIVSVDDTYDGNENIELVGCGSGSTSCVVKPSPSAIAAATPTQSQLAYLKVTYMTSSGAEEYVIIKFAVGSGNVAYLIDVSDSCSFSGWTFNDELKSRSNGESSGLYAANSEGVALPSSPCVSEDSFISDKSVPAKFKGYVVGELSAVDDTGDTAIRVTFPSQPNNRNLHSVGDAGFCDGAVAGGTSTSSGNVYLACYEWVPYVQLGITGGSLVDGDSWVSNDGGYEFIHYNESGCEVYDESNSGCWVELPEIDLSGYNSDTEFVCYYKNNDTSTCYQPGDSVALDGSTYEASTKLVRSYYDVYKTVKVGKTVKFTLADSAITSCSLEEGASSKISVAFVDGKCEVTGNAVTDKDEFVGVIAEFDGGSRRYMFSVENNATSIVVADSINKNTSDTYSDYGDFQTNSCYSYNIRYHSKKENWGTYDGHSLSSTLYSVESRCKPKDNNDYVALCLDPGRAGPDEPSTDVIYTRVSDLTADSPLGRLAVYITNHYGSGDKSLSEIMLDTDADERVAIHIASRIVAIQSGYGSAVDSSDIKYAAAYNAYQAVVNKLNEGASVDDALNLITWNGGNAIRNEVSTILSNYNIDNDTDVEGFERRVSDTNVEITDDGYTITYTGTIIAPAGTSNLNLAVPENNLEHVDFYVDYFDDSTIQNEPNNRTVYDFIVRVVVNNAYLVDVPTSEVEQLLYSFVVTYEGGSGLDNIFIAQPDSGDALQRMLIFNVNNKKVYIYFNIAANNCDVPGLDYTKCKNASECSESDFNMELFKASGCCRYVTNESEYQYVVQSVCNSSCTTSTMSSVCSYNPNNLSQADIYEIKEGTYFTGSGVNEYALNIGGTNSGGGTGGSGICVVNVGQYTNGVSNSNDFEIDDDSGNPRNVSSYSDNQYCRVTCAEDWEITMDSFGNYVGLVDQTGASAAGSYFQIINNDIFIGGTRTCYTSYINYVKYLDDIADLSQKVVDEFSSYSNYAHAYSDLEIQKKQYFNNDDASELEINLSTENSGDALLKCTDWYQRYENPGADSDDKNGPDLVISESNSSYPLTCRKETSEDLGGSAIDLCDNTAHSYKWKYTYESDDSSSFCSGGGSPSGDTCTSTTVREYYKDASGNKICGVAGSCPSTYPYEYYDPGSCRGNTSSGTTCYKEVGGEPYSASKSYTCAAGYEHETDASDPTCVKYVDATPATTGGNNNDGYQCPNEYSFFAHSAELSAGLLHSDLFGACNEGGESGTSTACPEDLGDFGASTDGKYYTTDGTAVDLSTATKNGFTGVTGTSLGSYGNDSYSWGPVGTNPAEFCSVTTDYENGDSVDGLCYSGNGNATDPWVNKEDDIDEDKAILEAFDYLYETYSEELKGASTGALGQVNVYISDVMEKVNDMYECQHFQLNNDTTGGKTGTVRVKGKLYGTEKEFAKITSSFNPQVYYNYDEDVYMQILETNNENWLEEYTSKNDKAFESLSKKYDEATNISTNVDICTGNATGNTDADGDGKCDSYVTLDLARNDIKATYYNSNSAWNNSNYAKTYGLDSSGNETGTTYDWNTDGELKSVNDGLDYEISTIVVCTATPSGYSEIVSESKNGPVASSAAVYDGGWRGGYCYEISIPYVKATYVKSSISNSSFYKNRGNWYIKNGYAEHGDTLEDAINNALNDSGRKVPYKTATEEVNSESWTPHGLYNVFPISMTTPRNLYTYTYTFTEIGSYGDGRTGRIMDDDGIPVVGNNDRTCFYEVVEEICLCCGDWTINSYVDDDDDTVYDSNGDGINDSSIYVDEFLEHSGYGYEKSDSTATDSYASMGFVSSSVSLSDLTAPGATVADNWSDSSLFLYAGNSKLTTNKGAVAAANIEAAGETIYATTDTAEYSYILTPNTLSNIRSYNDTYGYEVNYDNLRLVGRYSIASLNGGSSDSSFTATTEEMNEIINFQHYGSVFLEEFMYDQNAVVTSLARNNGVVNDKVCSIVDDKSSNDRLSEINNLMDDGCRWIDYIENLDGNTGPNTYYYPYDVGQDTGVQYFRLAFK